MAGKVINFGVALGILVSAQLLAYGWAGLLQPILPGGGDSLLVGGTTSPAQEGILLVDGTASPAQEGILLASVNLAGQEDSLLGWRAHPAPSQIIQLQASSSSSKPAHPAPSQLIQLQYSSSSSHIQLIQLTYPAQPAHI
ncbi:hypothetical protein PGT21_000968 [Puccinia graminis f. sp. tritici]|uniref:Uncharacterized protein n=1 Tax=Puccinia graminis f. sp. tritici TaxID=56615 RepID=A0A5B0MQJ7_PUCGR|nr:hypothetical protein PGT21_000968 [Puccinia graminis f. sp. tritici]